MDRKYIEKLEFDKIVDILINNCITQIGKNLAKNLHPENEKDIVSSLLKETTEATTLIYKKNTPPITEIANFEYIEKMLKSNSSLNIKHLLEVAKILKLSNNLKEYYFNDNEERTACFPILDEYFSMLYTNVSIR